MKDYQKGKIYKLYSLEGDEIYIGSTILTLTERLSIHKYDYNKHKLITCNSIILFEKYKEVNIELIELYPCNSRKELERREGEIQQINKEFIVNIRLAGRTNKEYYQDNKINLKKQMNEYNKKNKDKINEYIEENKDKIKEYARIYREANKEKMRAYIEQNKEKIIEYKRIYREKKKALKNTIPISQ